MGRIDRVSFSPLFGLAALALTTCPSATLAQAGQVDGEIKLPASQKAFSVEGQFGRGITALGDVDGDGIEDIAVGATTSDVGGTDRGAVWVLLLNADGTAKSTVPINDLEGGFAGKLDDGDQFGRAVAGLGDLDGDGVEDLAVGAPFDDAGGTDRGAVWILFLNADGTVREHQKISTSANPNASGGFQGNLNNGDQFGASIANIGDLNGDKVADIVVGSPRNNAGGTDRGAVWVLFLNMDGTVASHVKVSPNGGGFTGAVNNNDFFGMSVAAIGDVDNDGVEDIAVGASSSDAGGNNRGAVWIVFMLPNGIAKGQQELSSTAGNFSGGLNDNDRFGISVAPAGDLDGNQIPDIAVGAMRDDDGGLDQGAVWIVFLANDGTATGESKISAAEGGFGGALADNDRFGHGLGLIGNFGGTGGHFLAAGATGDDSTNPDGGAVWLLSLNLDVVFSDVGQISVAAGGTQTITLNLGNDNAGLVYFLLGSVTGTSPGFLIDAVQLALNLDDYLLFTLTSPNSPPLGNSFGTLDIFGSATSTVTVPAGTDSGLVGFQLDHAFIVIDPFPPVEAVIFASTPQNLELID